MWARLWVQPANSANEQSWWESSKIERIWINKASIHPSVSSRRWQSCLLTYVQRKAWGKEKHNAYPSSKAPGPFLPGFLSSYFRSLCVNKYGDSSDLCLPLPNLRADPYGTTPYAVNMGMAQQSLPNPPNSSPKLLYTSVTAKHDATFLPICDKFANLT